jgi:2-oxo-4-hydroxy-4-carboxy-5-ureidoimidazoline decarboxylase
MTLEQVNALTTGQFVAEFGALLEDADWVIEALAQARPFVDVDAFKGAVVTILGQAPSGLMEPVIRRHPKLGVLRPPSAFSGQEQKAAGLGELSEAERTELLKLNKRYEALMGIPFIVAVAGMTRQDILQRLRERLENDPKVEFRTAVAELAKIVGYRIDSLVAA